MTTDHMELRAALVSGASMATVSCEAIAALLREFDRLASRGNKGMVSFRTFMAQCKDRNEQPIPSTSTVFQYAEEAGISQDVLRIHWMEFKARHADEAKFYRDWRKAFNKSVRGNWFKLWYFDSNGVCTLTTTGVQAKNAADVAAKRKAA